MLEIEQRGGADQRAKVAKWDAPQKVEKTPADRTQEFFAQTGKQIAKEMKMKQIWAADGARIRVTDAQSWSAQENDVTKSSNQYLETGNIQFSRLRRGQAGVFLYGKKYRPSQQIYIAVEEGGRLGGCVRLKTAEEWSDTDQRWKPLPSETAISTTLGLKEGDVVTFEFRDETDVLYVVGNNAAKSEKKGKAKKDKRVPTKADRITHSILDATR